MEKPDDALIKLNWPFEALSGAKRNALKLFAHWLQLLQNVERRGFPMSFEYDY
jgi:hypothetical protein